MIGDVARCWFGTQVLYPYTISKMTIRCLPASLVLQVIVGADHEGDGDKGLLDLSEFEDVFLFLG